MVGSRHLMSSKVQGTATRVALLVAGCLLIATAGDAFVASRSFQVTTPTQPTHPSEVKTTQPARSGFVAPERQFSLFKAAASVALLCLAATRSKSRSKSPSIRYAVVGMTSTLPSKSLSPSMDLMQFDDSAAKEAQPCAKSIPVISMDTEPLAAPCAEPAPVMSLDATPLSCVPSVKSDDTQTPLGDSLCGKNPARFVAGARRGQSHARTASAGRAARRAVGQRLCASMQHAPMPSTFDASKTRTKIQLGLRVSSCMRSEAGRESKVSSGVEGSEMMGTCLNFVAHDLKVYTARLQVGTD